MCYPAPFGGKVWQDSTDETITREEKKIRAVSSALLKYRFRRYARLSRWMLGDKCTLSYASRRDNYVPITTLFFFSTFSSFSGFQILESILKEISDRNEKEKDDIQKFETAILDKYLKTIKLRSLKNQKIIVDDKKCKMDFKNIDYNDNLLVGRWKCSKCSMFNSVDMQQCLCCNLCQDEDESEEEDEKVKKCENEGEDKIGVAVQEKDPGCLQEIFPEHVWQQETVHNAVDMDEEIAIGIDIENYGDHYDDYKSVGDEDNHLNQNQNCEKNNLQAKKKTLFLLYQSKKGIYLLRFYFILFLFMIFLSIFSYFRHSYCVSNS